MNRERSIGQRTHDARAFFFARVERHGINTARDERTLPLFPLVLILEADGTLAAGCRHLPRMVQA